MGTVPLRLATLYARELPHATRTVARDGCTPVETVPKPRDLSTVLRPRSQFVTWDGRWYRAVARVPFFAQARPCLPCAESNHTMKTSTGLEVHVRSGLRCIFVSLPFRLNCLDYLAMLAHFLAL